MPPKVGSAFCISNHQLFALRVSRVGASRTNSRLIEVDRGNSELINATHLQNNLQIKLTRFSLRVHSLHDASGITRLRVRHRNTERGRADHEPGVSWPRLRGSGFSPCGRIIRWAPCKSGDWPAPDQFRVNRGNSRCDADCTFIDIA